MYLYFPIFPIFSNGSYFFLYFNKIPIFSYISIAKDHRAASCSHPYHSQEVATHHIASLTDEWNLYQIDQKTTEMLTDLQTNPHICIDHYWKAVIEQKGSTGELKYPTLSKVIKAAIILPHGNADVERGFSVSNNVLTEDRTDMSVETLNGLLLTKDALAFHDPEKQLPSSLPITRSLLQSCCSAYGTYQARLEREKVRKQEEAKKAEEQEKHLKRKCLEEERDA